jgi:hypothetical protein
MSHDHDPKFDLSRLPVPIKRLVVFGGLAAIGAGCGSSPNRVSSDTAQSPDGALVAQNDTYAKPTATATSENHPNSAKNPDGNVSDLIQEMVSGQYTGGEVPVFKDGETAAEAIIVGVSGVPDALPDNITLDEVKTVMDKATDQEVVVALKDPNKPEAQWDHPGLHAHLKYGDIIKYKLVPPQQ